MVSIARKNLFHDKIRFIVAIAGIQFSVLLITIQIGVFLRFLTNASVLIDHSGADLWITAKNLQNFDFGRPFSEKKVYLARKVQRVWGGQSQPLRDIARIMLDTGMRPEEVFRIEFANLNFDRWTIFSPLGKTPAAKRTVPMTEEVWNLLKSRAIAEKGRYVFPSPKNPDTPIKGVRKGHDKSVARA